MPCPLPIASSNKSLQGKDPLAFPLPVQKCLELGNFTSVFQMWGENLVLKKILNFLSFMVLLYVSGHLKQKKILAGFMHVLTYFKVAGEKPGDPCLARIYYCLCSAGDKASASTLLYKP